METSILLLPPHSWPLTLGLFLLSALPKAGSPERETPSHPQTVRPPGLVPILRPSTPT